MHSSINSRLMNSINSQGNGFDHLSFTHVPVMPDQFLRFNKCEDIEPAQDAEAVVRKIYIEGRKKKRAERKQKRKVVSSLTNVSNSQSAAFSTLQPKT